MYAKAKFLLAGDKGLIMEFSDFISSEVNKKVRSMSLAIEKFQLEGIEELIPTYSSLLILYDPLVWRFCDLTKRLAEIEKEMDNLILPAPIVTILPVLYGQEYGPDLSFVCEHNNLTAEEVIKLHTSADYLIYMLGFTPGFPYLAGMDERLTTPRLSSPRTKIPQGSVGIAGSQTGVYPIESPGGWQLIGRTPLKLYDPARENPVLLEAGNYVRFSPITSKEYDYIIQEIKQGTYTVKTEKYLEREVEKMTKFKVIKSGLQTTIQDRGRLGYQRWGIPVAGAMDEYALRVANLLVDNHENEACLEITLLGPELEFQDSGVVAVTGADLGAKLNRKVLPLWQSVLVNKGDILSFTGLKQGCRAYLAVAGGLDVPVVMGSKATYLRGGIGGYQGRALIEGDILKAVFSQKGYGEISERIVPVNYRHNFSEMNNVRVVLGPQKEAFSEKGINTFLENKYRVTNEADRMGYRLESLEGNKIEHKTQPDIISDGIARGSIQVPGHGEPIIMMADRQTTGGYTKIATIITPDLSKIAQAKPGDFIQFQGVSIEEAQMIYKEHEQKILELKQKFAKNAVQTRTTTYSNSQKTLQLRINGKEYQVEVEEVE